MLPPGRRRSILALISLALVLLLSTASAASAVLGIDLGTEYIKAALVKPGIPLEIVLTKDSKRKEAAAVAFKPSSASPSDGETNWPERLYGGDALALSARFPGDVYANLKALLGVEYETDFEWPARNPALEMVPLETRRTAAFRSRSLPGEDMPFSVEELLAMQLKNVRENAETMAGKSIEIRDAVVTVPSYYTADQRRALGLAAELAGLNVLALVSDGLAVGLNYATSREFPSASEGAKPEYHMVLDMGAGSTTATVVRFQGRMVKDVGKFNKTVQEVAVMGVGWDKTLGGDALNVLVREDMIAKFLVASGAKSAGVEAAGVKSNGRTMAKLWREAERIRQVLSANSEASASFEGLHEDVDFRYKLSRADFEDMAVDFAARVDGPVQRALAAANVSMEELDSVILHGGLARTPLIQKRLEGLAVNPAKLRSNVNADEAAAFGALYKGAGLSPSFRVKEIRDSDAAGYIAGIKWMAEGKERHQKLFTPSSLMGPAKQITFKNLEDFSFTMYQQIPKEEEGTTNFVDRGVSEVRTSNLTASVSELVDKHGCRKDNITTKFTIRIDPLFGIPEVTQGTVSCEVEPEKPGVVDGVKGFFGFGGKKNDQQPLDDDEYPPEPVESASVTPVSSAEGTESPAPASSAQPTPKVPKKKTVSTNLSFTIESRGLTMPSAAELVAMKKRLASFDASDRSRKQREEVFNTLEGLTYRVRDLLEDDAIIAVSSEAQRSALREQVSTTSEWLYGEGSTASLDAVKAKLSELKSLVDPIQKRKEEVARRPEQIRALKEALDQTNKLVAIIREQIEAASAASASLEAASSTATSDSSSSTVATDDFADLEDETATSSSTTTTASPTPSSYFTAYTAEDVAEISSAYETTKSWLSETLAEQDKLSAFEDPVLVSKDLQDRTKKLNDVVSELLARKIKFPPRSSKSKPAKPKTKKSKSKTSTAAEASSSAEADANIPVVGSAQGQEVRNDDGSVQGEKLEDAIKRQGYEGRIHEEL